MPDFSQLLTAIISGSLVGSVIPLANFISGRLKERRERIEAANRKKVSDAVEVKRLEIESKDKQTATTEAALWKLLEERETEIADLKVELKECEKGARLERPLINKVLANLRTMRRDLEALNTVKRDVDEHARFVHVKELLDQTEELLP
jgi:hypothetical protein